ncbi:hypothetical protein Tco_0851894 [Tanacetum coccineum]
MAQRRAIAPSIYHSLLPAGTPPFLPIPLPAPSTSHRVDIPEADTPPQKRLILTAPSKRAEIEIEILRRLGVEIEILRRERLAYEQESIETSQALTSYWIVSANVMNRSIRIDIPIRAPHPSEYVLDPMELEDHVPVYIPELEHPEDLVLAEDEAPMVPYIYEVASTPTLPLPPPSLLPTLI